MYNLINNPPYNNSTSGQLTLLVFGFQPIREGIKKFIEDPENNEMPNMLLKLIIRTHEYAKMCLDDYSCKYSNHINTQPALFTILSIKTYLDLTYKKTCEVLALMPDVVAYLGLKKVPHPTTIQKFFKRFSSGKIGEINDSILSKHNLNVEIAALDGSGFTNDYADKYYAQIRKKERKSFIKYHIAIDTKTGLILHHSAQKGPRHDTKFAKPAIRCLKKYNPHYIAADKAYDSEEIRKCIFEEIGAFDQIPLKKRAKKGKYRLISITSYRYKAYTQRNRVECVFSVIKRVFSGINYSRSTNLSIKETKLKGLIYNIYRSIQIS